MVAGFWTLDRTTITGRSAVILRQHTTPFRPMIVPFDDLELVYQSLRTLETPHTHKFPRVNAQDCRLGPIQPWDVKNFSESASLPTSFVHVPTNDSQQRLGARTEQH
jgi:hypothetical protein